MDETGPCGRAALVGDGAEREGVNQGMMCIRHTRLPSCIPYDGSVVVLNEFRGLHAVSRAGLLLCVRVCLHYGQSSSEHPSLHYTPFV